MAHFLVKFGVDDRNFCNVMIIVFLQYF